MTEFAKFYNISDFLNSFGYMQPIHLSEVIKYSGYLSHRKRGKSNINAKNIMGTHSLFIWTLVQQLFSIYAGHTTLWYGV